MFIKVKVKNYEYFVWSFEKIKQFEKTIVLMHGWNTNHENFKKIYNSLSDKYNIIAFDALGFGKSDEIKEVFSLEDYVSVLKGVLDYYKAKYRLRNFYLLGHSFGGRVIIKYLSEIKNNDCINGIILSSSAGIKHESFKLKKKVFFYKVKRSILKFLAIFSKKAYKKLRMLLINSGSNDYKNLKPLMKKTMTNVIKEDLTNLIPLIKLKTLITWGEKDEVTPFSDAYVFLNNIESSRLIVFHESAHFPHLSEENKYVEAIDNALSTYFVS